MLLRERQPAFAAALAFAEQDRAAPQRWLAEVGRQAGGIQRARIVLLAAQCLQNGKIARHFSVYRTSVITLRTRRAEGGLSALVDRPKGFG
jgi:hypothetical protein